MIGSGFAMQNQSFNIYSERYVHLFGEITDGCLHLESDVYGDDYDSEKHYMFSKEETAKLFSLISLKDFIALCRKEYLIGMERFLEENGITYRSAGF